MVYAGEDGDVPGVEDGFEAVESLGDGVGAGAGDEAVRIGSHSKPPFD
jgi:hypothetical protein